MKIRFVFDSWFARSLGVGAVTLYPFVFFAYGELQSVAYDLTSHEMVHVEQVRTIGWLAFYWRYFVEYVSLRFSNLGHNAAYRALSFEDEAYRRASDPNMREAYRSERARD